MKKTKVEPLQESLDLISENSLKRLNQKVWNLTIMVIGTLWGTDNRFSAHRWLLKHSELFMMRNLVNPVCSRKGRNSVRSNNGMRGRGKSKKQKPSCNEMNRGLELTLIRKDADLLYGVLLHEWRHDL
jgi:hypothetical protein